MKYENMVEATFIERPNRFIAHCEVKGEKVSAHVKNTGRCKELLTCNATVFLEHNNNPLRKTQYSLISVVKNNMLINMDSQAPNKVVKEGLVNGKIKIAGFDMDNLKIKSEAVFGSSRLDFFIDDGVHKGYIEVKGVTLEKDGVVLFPDAPTIRGIKHINELIYIKKQGFFYAGIIFVIQLKGAKHFEPNNQTHKEFGQALKMAKISGVDILAYDCLVTTNSLNIDEAVLVKGC